MEISISAKFHSAEFFLIFPVSSAVCDKKLFMKKYGVTGLVFEILATFRLEYEDNYEFQVLSTRNSKIFALQT